jgi:hypothetical protein
MMYNVIRKQFFIQFICLLALCGTVSGAQITGRITFGYTDNPGSALVLLAEEGGHFRAEHLQPVILHEFSDSAAGVEALVSGKIDVGAFRIEDVLRAIAAGKELRIIAGGGTPQVAGPLAELDEVTQSEMRLREIVTVVRGGENSPGKNVTVQIVSALIRAHLALVHSEKRERRHIFRKWESRSPEAGTYLFNPNPDYFRFDAVWKELKLQRPEMRRDHLANHVYEEIYCDSLDRIVIDGDLSDPALQQLIRKAICTPNCCPANTGKLTTIQGGIAQ